MQTAAVILAAGASTRFGSPKQLAPVGNSTMLEAVVGVARSAGLNPIVVVLPSSVPPPAGAIAVTNDVPHEGMSRSLRLGLAAVPAEATAALILLGDQPTVSAAFLAEILRGRSDRPIVAARARGLLAPPVLLDRSAFGMAQSATGDEGLRDLIRGNRHLVTPVEVGEHAPDVDTRDDLASLTERCPGCGALYLPGEQLATHEYIGASPACWATFSELIAYEFQDPSYGAVHRHTVDVYAAQHAGADGRRQRQSVAVHLVALCHWLEHGLGADRINLMTQALTSEKRRWPWLEPPEGYRLTVLDVLKATNGESHRRLVREWAASAWEAWSAHHEVVRGWAADALGAGR